MEIQANSIDTKKSSTYAKVLAIPSFRALWFGQICSQLAVNTLLFILALRVYHLTSRNTAVSGLFLAYGIPAVLFGLIAGTAVDRLDKRRVLILCDLVRSLFTLGLVLLSRNLFVIYLITFSNAFITQFYFPSEAPLIPKLIPKELLVSANSLFSFTYYTSLAIGSLLAGPLLRIFGVHGIFIGIAALFACASYLSSKIDIRDDGSVGFRHLIQYDVGYLLSRIWMGLLDGIRYVAKSKQLSGAIVLLTGTQIIIVLLASLGPGFADQILSIDIRDASIVIVGPAVLGIIMGAIWVGTVGYRWKPEYLIRRGIQYAGLILLVIAVSIRLISIKELHLITHLHFVLIVEIFLFFLLGIANSLLDVPANSLLQEEASGPMRGRVYGMLTAFVGGVGILPIILGGILADTIGIGNVILILGIIITLVSIVRKRYSHLIQVCPSTDSGS
jgi:MFS family permease